MMRNFLAYNPTLHGSPENLKSNISKKVKENTEKKLSSTILYKHFDAFLGVCETPLTQVKNWYGLLIVMSRIFCGSPSVLGVLVMV